MKSIAYLVSKGVPWDVAVSFDDVELHAWTVMFGELDGGNYSWSNCRFENS